MTRYEIRSKISGLITLTVTVTELIFGGNGNQSRSMEVSLFG